MLIELCTKYLNILRPMANKHGLLPFVDTMVKDMEDGKCKPTDEEAEMLSRMVDDERLSRTEVPKLFSMSYRKFYEQGLFDRVKTLKHQGIYSKISAIKLLQKYLKKF